MARIGNSVFLDICPDDPTCSKFGFYQGGIPTPMMEKCLLYKMVQYGTRWDASRTWRRTYTRTAPQLTARSSLCRPPRRRARPQPLAARVHVQVWQGAHLQGEVGLEEEQGLGTHTDASRTHTAPATPARPRLLLTPLSLSLQVADPANRVCDAPGSWYCTGQYPPALSSLIARRKNFRQLEDFNVGQDEQSRKYQEEYHKRMSGRRGPSEEPPEGSVDYGLAFVGCFGAEKKLGDDRVYGGGAHGAQIGLAVDFALKEKKRYIAIARSGVDGHVFAFNNPASKSTHTDEGCDIECLDDPAYSCGCADDNCGSSRAAKGEEHVRRWVVYELPEGLERAAAEEEGEKGGRSEGKSEL